MKAAKEHVLVVAELPGMGKKEIAYELNNSVLIISAHGGRRYREEVSLRSMVDAGDVKAS